MLETNFKVVGVDHPLGNKHDFPKLDSHSVAVLSSADYEPQQIQSIEESLHYGRVRFVHISKPLLSWLPSFHGYRELKAQRQIELTEKNLTIYFYTWIATNLAWSEFVSSQGFNYLVLFDDLLVHGGGVLEQLRLELELPRRSVNLKSQVPNYIKRSNDGQHGKQVRHDTKFFDANKYLIRVTNDLLSQSHLEIASRLFFQINATEHQDLD